MLTTVDSRNATQKIAFYGVISPPFTGQTIMTDHALSVLDGMFRIDRYTYDPMRLRLSLRPLFKLLLLFRNAGCYKSVYIILSSTRPWRNLFVLIILKMRGLSIFGHVHSSLFGHKKLDKLAIGLLTKCIFLDELLIPPKCSLERISIVPNTISGIFDSVKRNTVEELSIERYEKKRLLFISNLWPDKGVEDLLKLMDSIDSSYSLSVIGDVTPETEEFVIQGLERKHNVTFLGALSDREIILKHLLASSALVFPTRYRFEAQPLVILEALCAGLPILTNGIGSIPNMVTNGMSGLIHNRFDVREYKNSIDLIFKDYETYKQFSINAYKTF